MDETRVCEVLPVVKLLPPPPPPQTVEWIGIQSIGSYLYACGFESSPLWTRYGGGLSVESHIEP